MKEGQRERRNEPAAETAVVKVMIPVFETKEFPGKASIKAEALEAGVGAVDWFRTLLLAGSGGSWVV